VVWFLRLLAEDVMFITNLEGEKVEDPEYDGPDLRMISDILRFIFNFIPCLPQARATMALIQVINEVFIH